MSTRIVKSQETFLQYWLCVALRALADKDYEYADRLAGRISEDLPGEPFDHWQHIRSCAKERP